MRSRPTEEQVWSSRCGGASQPHGLAHKLLVLRVTQPWRPVNNWDIGREPACNLKPTLPNNGHNLNLARQAVLFHNPRTTPWSTADRPPSCTFWMLCAALILHSNISKAKTCYCSPLNVLPIC